MIRAVFFDIDGTLYSHKTRVIPASARKAIKELQEKGILVYVSTGRHLLEMKDLPVLDIPYDGYITLNGQIVLDRDHKIMFDFPLCDDMKDKIVALFESHELPLILVEENDMYLNFVNEKVIETQEELTSPIPPIHAYTGNPLYMACAYIRGGEEHLIQDKIPAGMRMSRWGDQGVDLIVDGDGKVDGIRKILEYLGITKEEIMAFGDGENDVQMLEFAQIGVAMGNALDIVKKSADYITEDIDEDGVYKALVHFGLTGEKS